MRRVLIVGSAGAGKTTLAMEISDRTGLPVIHLDQHFWLPGWREKDIQRWSKQVEKLAAESFWIMDGNYGGTLPSRLERADMVIFLDVAPTVCLWRVIRRTVSHFGKTRPDMAEGCKEHFNWEFLKYIWNYRRRDRPRLLTRLQNYSGDTIVIKNKSEASRFIANIENYNYPASTHH